MASRKELAKIVEFCTFPSLNVLKFLKALRPPKILIQKCALKRYFLSFDSSHVVWPTATLNFMPSRQEIQHKYSQTFPTSFSIWPSTNIEAATFFKYSNKVWEAVFFTAGHIQSYDAMILMRKSMEQQICKREVWNFLLEPEAMTNAEAEKPG